MSRNPKMSIVLATPDVYQTIKATVGHHRRQTVVNDLELVIVCPSRAGLGFDPDTLTEFASVKVAEVGTVTGVAQANAAGVRAASAPIVVFSEDHAFPEKIWAERLITAHEQAFAAVGPAVKNGNPHNAVAWADYLIAYGEWADPCESHEPTHLPGHNSSYKREELLAYGDQLESMLNAETVLHWDLRGKGKRIFLDASAKVAHVNFALWKTWLPVQFQMGRSFAASRAQDWSIAKRLAFVGGSVLIPAVRLLRVIKHAMAPSRKINRGHLLRTLPALFIGLNIDGLGQMVGYAFGPGDSKQRLCMLEFHRVNHILKRDRDAIAATT